MTKFTFQMTADEKKETCQAQTTLLQKIQDFCEKHHPDLAVCDELVAPVPWDSSRKNRSSIS